MPQDDGLPDAYELSSSGDYNGLPLYTLGARSNQIDLFIHVAPMRLESGNEDEGMMLQKAALDKVVSAFAAVGITLHFDVGTTGLYDGASTTSSGEYNLYSSIDGGYDHRVDYNDAITLNDGTDGDGYPSTVPSGASSGNYVFVNQLKKSNNYRSEKDYAFHYLVFWLFSE